MLRFLPMFVIEWLALLTVSCKPAWRPVHREITRRFALRVLRELRS